ncbi:hypothetical protein [Persephonella sp.]
MKKIKTIFILFVLLSLKTYSLEVNRNSISDIIDISAGIWYLNWEQNDESKLDTVKTPINHKFNIENSLAKEISISGQWRFLKGSIKYITSEGDKVADQNTKVDRLMAQLGLKWKDHLDTSFTYITTSTSGYAEGYDTKTNNSSYIQFNTDLKSMNLTFYPEFIFGKYIGFGSEYITYDLPQSFYITDGNNVIYRGIEPQMEWSAYFVTVELTNFNHIKNLNGWNIYYFLTGGYALKVDVNGNLAIDPSGYSSYLEGEKGMFYRGDIGIKYGFENILGFSLGYRISRFYLETKKNSDGINIYARAESLFSGPYLRLHLNF